MTLKWDFISESWLLPLSYLMFCFLPVKELKKAWNMMSLMLKRKHEQMFDVNISGLTSGVCTGSSAEGLGEIPYNRLDDLSSPDAMRVNASDLDIMVVFDLNCKYRVDDTDPMLHPGYTRIVPVNPDDLLEKFHVNVNDKVFVSSRCFFPPEDNLCHDEEVERGGPAHKSEVTRETKEASFREDSDIVPCLQQTSSWPDIASEWLTRVRSSGWPSAHLIDEIRTTGYDLVSAAHPFSAMPHVEWRYSFSRAELILSRSLTFTQRQCYVLMKTLCKFVLADVGVVKSYYLKNILYWCCEELPSKLWTPENLAECLFVLVDKLLSCLVTRNLPHYFIRKNNLISHFDREMTREAARRVVFLRRYPLKVVLDWSKNYVHDCSVKSPNSFEGVMRPVIEVIHTRLLTKEKFVDEIDRATQLQAVAHMESSFHWYAIDSLQNISSFCLTDECMLNPDFLIAKYIVLLNNALTKSPGNHAITAATAQMYACISVKTKVSEILLKANNDFCSALEGFPRGWDQYETLLHYSNFLLLNGDYRGAYEYANYVLNEMIASTQDEGMLEQVQQPVMLYESIGVLLDPLIVEEVRELSGMMDVPIPYYALYLAMKTGAKAGILNDTNATISIFEQILGCFKFPPGGRSLGALAFFEVGEFLRALEQYCLSYIADLPLNCLKKNILLCLLLELLEMNNYSENPNAFRGLAEKTLTLVRLDSTLENTGIYDIGSLLKQLASIYDGLTFVSFSADIKSSIIMGHADCAYRSALFCYFQQDAELLSAYIHYLHKTGRPERSALYRKKLDKCRPMHMQLLSL